jgi:fluoride ion exporter CrcB/FEX
MISGIVSTGVAIIGGLLATITTFSTFCFTKYLSLNEVIFRILVGIATFFLIAILTASISAIYQNYPLGLGRFFFY